MNSDNGHPDLRTFALRQIAADGFPDDRHVFATFECVDCGAETFDVTVEHHTGSKEGDFRGVIHGTCAACGVKKKLFSFTSEQRAWLRDDKRVCACGKAHFHVVQCERFETGGFFDEGVVVGKCCSCGRNEAFVQTD